MNFKNFTIKSQEVVQRAQQLAQQYGHQQIENEHLLKGIFEVDELPEEVEATIPVSLLQEPEVEGALIAMDNQTGAVRAMVGGFDFERSEFNRAVQSKLQCGSAFKPFVYLTAFQQGFTPADRIFDAPFLLPDAEGQLTYCPKNYYGKYYGITTLRRALEDSYNANPASLVAGVRVLMGYPGQHWLVLGDMKELGLDSSKMHREVGENARAMGVKRLFATGEMSAHTVDSFGRGAEHFETQEELVRTLRRQVRPGVNCLVKGSRSMGMEAVVAALVEESATREAG